MERTAYDAISGLTLSTVNYQETIEILQKRFGNKQLIISKHMETLLTVGGCDIRPEPEGSATTLRQHRITHEKFEVPIIIGVESESYGAILSSVLLTRQATYRSASHCQP